MILTDKDVEEVFDEVHNTDHCSEMFDYLYARALEERILQKLSDQELEYPYLSEILEDAQDIASNAMRVAWQLGQTYWAQADSDSPSEWKKSDQTQETFLKLIDDTRLSIAELKG